MKIKFDKLQSSSSDKGKTLKATFNGGYNMLDIGFTVSGDDEDVQAFLQALNVKQFGQQLDIEVSNPQSSLDDTYKED